MDFSRSFEQITKPLIKETSGMAIEDKNSPGNISRRGFAAMDADQRKKIASMGGKSAHEKGTAHQFTSEEAAAAGRKRGQI